MAQIAYFDDPINPHGWALQPVVRRLRCAFPELDWAYHPTVLVPSWDAYVGPEIENGRQGMAATCAQVSERSGMPIDEYLWFDDPPSSSVAACRAIAAAQREERATVPRLLRGLREATFIRRTNVSDDDQLRSVIDAVPDLDTEAVWSAMDDAESELVKHEQTAHAVDCPGVLRTDGRLTLPTLVVSETRGRSGYQEFATYRELIAEVTGHEPQTASETVETVIDRFSPWGWIATTELVELTECSYTEATEQAAELAVERTFASEPFWRDPAFVDDE